MIEPADSQEALDFTRLAFDISEEFDTPVMLRITTRLAHSQTLVEEGEPKQAKLKEYKKDAPKYVMLPGFARGRHVAVEKRLEGLKEYSNKTDLNQIEWGDRRLGVITSGVCYQYVREVMPDISVLKLGMVNPLPDKLIREFAQGVERLVVVEELEPVIEEQVKSWGIAVEGKEQFTLLGEYSPEYLAERLGGVAQAQGYGLDKEIPHAHP